MAGTAQVIHIMANSGWAWHFFAAPAVWIGRMRGVPTVINYRGGYAADFFERSITWVRPTLRCATSIIVPSEFLQQVFTRFGFTAELVPNIIDLKRFAPNADGRPVNPAAPHIIVTRNLEDIYDIGTALRALAIVREQWPAARMTVAGSGPQMQALVALTETLGLTQCVTFSGRLDNEQIPALYQQADVFVNPSLVDNMPISILESLASGVPVVTTDVGGIPFLVEHDRTALMVPPGDAAAMAGALLALLGDRARAERLAAEGREYVQRYTWPNVRGRLFDVYAAIAADAGKTVAGAAR
jgi:L-malate glycosyltransferase